MKIFSIFYLIAGVSFGMPMADGGRDSFNAEMERIRQFIAQTEESNKQYIEENRRFAEESNRKTADLLKVFDDKLKEIIEKYGN